MVVFDRFAWQANIRLTFWTVQAAHFLQFFFLFFVFGGTTTIAMWGWFGAAAKGSTRGKGPELSVEKVASSPDLLKGLFTELRGLLVQVRHMF